MARNYISNLGKGRRFEKPIAFQGGVADNKGVVKAFEELLELKLGELVIPDHFKVMGAIGAAMIASERNSATLIRHRVATEGLRRYLAEKASKAEVGRLTRLIYAGNGSGPSDECPILERQRRAKVYIGVDVGAVSTNIVVLDENKKLLAMKYLMTEGNPIESVKKGLRDIGREIKDLIEVQAEGTTLEQTTIIAQEMGAALEDVPEVANYQIHAGTSGPYNFNGLVRHYFLRRGPNVADLQVNLVPKHDRKAKSHDVAKRGGRS